MTDSLEGGLSKHNFESVGALAKWLAKECMWWNATTASLSQCSPLPETIESIQSSLHELAKRAERSDDRALAGLLTATEQFYRETGAFESRHSIGRFIQSFLPGRPLAALAALQYLTGSLPELTTREALDGTLSAALFRKGLGRKVHVDIPTLEREWSTLLQRAVRDLEETARLTKLQLADLPERIHELNGRIDDAQRHVKSSLEAVERHAQSRIDKLAGEGKAAAAKLTEHFRSEIANHIVAFEQRTDHFTKRYEAGIILKKPREYWESKRTAHSASKALYAKILVAGGAGVATGLVALAAHLLTNSSTLPVRGLTLFLLVSVFGFWLIRVLLRLFMLHVTLETDAQERVVMVETYLAMLEQGATSPEERVIIISSLFRPANQESAKEEFGPSSGLELLTKLVGGK